MEGFWLVLWIVGSAAVAYMASGKRQNPFLWFVVAFLFSPLLASVILMCIPGQTGSQALTRQDRLKQIRDRRREVEEKREAKRLEDERRLERQQNQQLHFALMNKLASPPVQPPSHPLPPALRPEFDSPPPLPTEMPAAESWHVVVAGKKLGPLSIDMIVNLAKNKRIGPDTMVWRKGTPEWTTLKTDPDLMAMLSHLLT